MCIRDRPQLELSKPDQAVAVSYTHLDVYKRQPLRVAAPVPADMLGLLKALRDDDLAQKRK